MRRRVVVCLLIGFAMNGYAGFAGASCAYGTKVIVPANNPQHYQVMPIEQINPGNRVYALEAEGDDNAVWKSNPVKFSSGVGPGIGSMMMYIRYGTEGQNEIIVTLDHVFLLSDLKLKRADRLTPDDTLINYKGEPVPIRNIMIGQYSGGIHQISTSDTMEKTWEKHLIITGDLVSGDYMLQILYENSW